MSTGKPYDDVSSLSHAMKTKLQSKKRKRTLVHIPSLFHQRDGDATSVLSSVHPILCPKCVAGSGRLLGHRGRHTTKLRSKAYQPFHPRQKNKSPCLLCIPGSGRLAGHRGRHTTTLPTTTPPGVRSKQLSSQITEVKDSLETVYSIESDDIGSRIHRKLRELKTCVKKMNGLLTKMTGGNSGRPFLL